MTKEQRLQSALGFAMKAGKVRSGALAAEKAVKGRKARVAVVDVTVSDATRAHWESICHSAEIPLLFIAGVGRAIGRDAHMIACVVDKGFADMILQAHKKDIES